MTYYPKSDWYQPEPSDCEPYPSEADLAAYEAEQERSAAWANAGCCMGCGAPDAPPVGYCDGCMDELMTDCPW